MTEESFKKVKKRLPESIGQSGIDLESIVRRLLIFGVTSEIFRQSIAKMVEWLANNYLP